MKPSEECCGFGAETDGSVHDTRCPLYGPLRDAVQALEHDPVNSPSHYKAASGMEAVDVMEAFDTDRNLSNVLKYVLRAGNKDDELKDLCKARRWLNRKINALSGKKSWEEE